MLKAGTALWFSHYSSWILSLVLNLWTYSVCSQTETWSWHRSSICILTHVHDQWTILPQWKLSLKWLVCHWLKGQLLCSCKDKHQFVQSLLKTLLRVWSFNHCTHWVLSDFDCSFSHIILNWHVELSWVELILRSYGLVAY